MSRTGRIISLTGGLVVAGALFGALAGTIALAIAIAITEGPSSLTMDSVFLFPAAWGAIFGGIGAPIAGWILMRSVPLGRAFFGSVLGAVLGGVLGWVLPVAPDQVSRATIGAIAGYLLAVIGLRVWGQSHTPHDDAAV